MKNLFLIIVIVSAASWMQAQTIPNAGFESWINPSGWYINPENWATNNSHIFTPVQQDTNSCTGNFALAINHDYASITGYAKTSFPLYETLSAIKVYVKCEVYPTDKVSIQVNLYLNSQAKENCIWTSLVSIPEWTPITIPITQKCSDGDSLEIIITGGDSLQTYFSVDDLSFDIISAIDVPGDRIFKLYPNPAREILNIDFSSAVIGIAKVSVMNTGGQTVMQQEFRIADGTNHFMVPVSGLKPGLYMIRISTNEAVMTRKLMITK